MFKSTSCLLSTVVGLGLIAALAPTSTLAQTPLDPVTAARHGTVMEFGLALARSGTSAGIYLPEEPVFLGPHVPRFALRDKDNSMVEEALDAFARTHRDYRVEKTQFEGVVIAPRVSTPCVAEARSRLRSLTTAGSAYGVLYRIFRMWSDDTTQYLEPGLVAGGTPDDTYDLDIFLKQVSLSVTDSTLENALNELIHQVEGLGWYVQPRVRPAADPRAGESGCLVGLFTGRARVTTDFLLSLEKLVRPEKR